MPEEREDESSWLNEPVRVSFVVPRDFRELLRDSADYVGMSMSELIRVAIYEYIDRHNPARRPLVNNWTDWRRLWESRHFSLMVELQEQALRLAKSPELAWRDDLEDVSLNKEEE